MSAHSKIKDLMKYLIALYLFIWPLGIFTNASAQETRIISFAQDGTLTWTNSTTNVFSGVQYTFDFRTNAVEWQRSPYWNLLITNPTMTVQLPLAQISASQMYLKVVSSPNRLPAIPGSETYDVNTNGIPRFVKYNYIELGKIEKISFFRSAEGHDYSDDFESCRSMKHYFLPSNTVDWASIQIRSPVAGTVVSVEPESFIGTQVHIKSADFPAFYFIIFHVQTNSVLSVGDSVTANQLLGTHVGPETTSDIAVGVNTPTGWQLVSYFDVMTDDLFAIYQARGINTRADAIISKAARDADSLTCDGESFQGSGQLPGWVVLH